MRNTFRFCNAFLEAFFVIALFEGCHMESTAGQGALLSDGYISWTTQGEPFVVHDSMTAGDPGENLLAGVFEDSTLSLMAGLAPLGSGKSIQINIAHCSGIGSYVFSTWSGDSRWPGESGHSYAYVNIPGMQRVYGTDSLLEGLFVLSRLDTLRGRIAGTFAFTARRLNGTDTMRVGNGVVFDFPVSVVNNR